MKNPIRTTLICTALLVGVPASSLAANAPVLLGATAFPGTTKVGLKFDTVLDAASAETAANYKVNGAAVTSALVRTNVANEVGTERNLVQLTVATALTADFTVTVSGVKDASGNAMASTTVPGKILNLTSTDIGSPAGQTDAGTAWGPDPQAPSTVATWGPGNFDVLTTGSNDYWNNADGFNFLWEPKTNSFDVKVRVVSVSPVNNWSAGAIEVREGPPTDNGKGWELSRHYFSKVDYGGPGAVPVLDGSGSGANSYEFNARLAPGDPTVRETGNGAPGGSVGWGGAGPGNPNPVPFPNAWIRIARAKSGTSDHLLGYSSSDGVNWDLRQDVDLNDDTHAGFLNLAGTPAGPMPEVLYVGLGSTSHTGIGNNNAMNEGTVGEFWYSPSGQPYSAYIIYRDYGDTPIPDTTPPVLLGATAFPGTTKVGLKFDTVLDAASAETAANYKVNGAAVTSALVRTNVANEVGTERNLVQLTVATALTADFTVTVSGVKDASGNAMASTTVPGKILNLTSTDIGSPAGQTDAGTAWGPDPQAPSTVATWGPGNFDVLTTGSNDYWNNADGFNFLWEPKTNSFDVKVRVVSVSPVNNWSAGAIEVREGPPTDNGKGWELSRHYFSKVDYGGPGAVPVLDGSGSGANSYEFNARLAPGDPTVRETGNGAPGGSVGWGGAGPGNPNPVPFPNAWIRIARAKSGTSDHLLGYSSSDGVNWDLRQDVDLNDDTHAGFLNLAGTPAGPMPEVLYVGLGSTSHTGIGNNNAMNEGTVGEFWYSPSGQPYSAYIIYRDYGDVTTATAPVDRPTLAFTLNADATVTLTYTGTLYSSGTVNGPYAAVSGATSPYKVTPKAATTPATFYQAGQ